jgi:hypothetical protein
MYVAGPAHVFLLPSVRAQDQDFEVELGIHLKMPDPVFRREQAES